MASKTIWIVASDIVVAVVRFAPDGVRDRSVVSTPPPPECGPHADHTGERNLNLDTAVTHHCLSVLWFCGILCHTIHCCIPEFPEIGIGMPVRRMILVPIPQLALAGNH